MAEDKNEIDLFLEEAASKSPGDEVSLTIRDFISKWGAKRRGYWYVQTINRDLETYGLTTEPSFETGWIDNHIRLIPERVAQQPTATVSSSVAVSDDQNTATQTAGTALRVSSLQSASADLTSINHSEGLDRAQSLMMQFDYSQLPVLSGPRDLLGAISWESIAQRRLHAPDCTLRDCIIPADIVGIDDDLLTHIPRVIEQGFVFVRARDRSISGIITTTDISANFLTLAGPFLLVGEVERHLRAVIVKHFTEEEIQAAQDARDTQRSVNSVDDLTLGEAIRLFQSRERWAQLGWQIERTVFLDALESLVELRNEIMHFSPDPVEEDRLTQVRNLSKWIKLLS